MGIRKIKDAELNQLATLFDGYRVFYKQQSDLNKATLFLSERIQNGDSEILVAVENGLLIGFVQLYPIFSSTRMKKLWLLNDLYVDPDFRGKGISKLLMEAAKQVCIKSNACGLILETAKSNLIGNALYPKVGFQLDEEHNYYFWDNE